MLAGTQSNEQIHYIAHPRQMTIPLVIAGVVIAKILAGGWKATMLKAQLLVVYSVC